MSLIQDALKRKREEEALLPPQEPARPEPPPAVDPEPVPSENGPAPSASRILLILVGVIGLLLILIALGLGKLRQTPAPATVEEVKPEPVAIVEAPAPPPPPPPLIEPKDKWPDLKLMGFASAGGQRMAVINGKMLSAGKRIFGVRVVEIGEDEVVLEYEGERRSLGGSE